LVRKNAVAVAIPEQDANLRRAAIQKDEEVTAQRAQPELCFDHQAQPIEAFA